MAARYLAPHLRNENQYASFHQHDTERYLSITEIQQYYSPNIDIMSADTCTLNASASNPNILSHILLFDGENPRWRNDKIIFVKSNLDLLPVERSDTSNHNGEHAMESQTTAKPPTSHDELPIAVFYQARKTDSARSFVTFKFDAWYRVSRLQLLMPDTPELERMLEQKFLLNHDSEVWRTESTQTRIKERMALEWAVIQLEEDEKANNEHEKPSIPRMSVNEALRLSRLKAEKAKLTVPALGVKEMLR